MSDTFTVTVMVGETSRTCQVPADLMLSGHYFSDRAQDLASHQVGALFAETYRAESRRVHGDSLPTALSAATGQALDLARAAEQEPANTAALGGHAAACGHLSYLSGLHCTDVNCDNYAGRFTR